MKRRHCRSGAGEEVVADLTLVQYVSRRGMVRVLAEVALVVESIVPAMTLWRDRGFGLSLWFRVLCWDGTSLACTAGRHRVFGLGVSLHSLSCHGRFRLDDPQLEDLGPESGCGSDCEVAQLLL